MKYLILLSGKLQSGKNQFAEYLTHDFNRKAATVKQDLFAQDLKDYSAEDFKLLGDVLEHKVQQIKSEIGAFFDIHNKASIEVETAIFNRLQELTFKPFNFYEEKTDITRALLQLYGTNIARCRFDDQFWVKKLAERISSDTETDVIIVTDVRFPNEVENLHNYVTNRRIVPIRIERLVDRNNITKQHASETALDDYKFFEYVIDNNGTLDDLKKSSDIITDELIVHEL